LNKSLQKVIDLANSTDPKDNLKAVKSKFATSDIIDDVLKSVYFKCNNIYDNLDRKIIIAAANNPNCSESTFRNIYRKHMRWGDMIKSNNCPADLVEKAIFEFYSANTNCEKIFSGKTINDERFEDLLNKYSTKSDADNLFLYFALTPSQIKKALKYKAKLVLTNKHCPLSLLEKYKDTINEVILNENVSKEIVVFVLNNLSKKSALDFKYSSELTNLNNNFFKSNFFKFKGINDPEILDILFKNEIWSYALTNFSKIPPDYLLKLSKSEFQAVRARLARSSKTSIAALTSLASDSKAFVRKKVASNKNTPVAVLLELASDKSVQVRRYLTYNINTPQEAIKKLCCDKDLEVKQNAFAHKNCPQIYRVMQ
jgi:hypothetical protein